MSMWIECEIAGHRWGADLSEFHDLSIQQDFGYQQPSFYEVGRAHRSPLKADGFIGDVGHGSACNVDRIEIIPHCHGTHTESAAHLYDEPFPPADIPMAALQLAVVVSVTPQALGQSGERYNCPVAAEEAVITAAELGRHDWPEGATAVVIRTLPNSPNKTQRHYHGHNSHPYLTLDAVELLLARGIDHILIDTPSIDRADDHGRLGCHRRFWELPEKGHEVPDIGFSPRSITEMIFVDEQIEDGAYLLNLQLCNWLTDAVPSRPLIARAEALTD